MHSIVVNSTSQRLVESLHPRPTPIRELTSPAGHNARSSLLPSQLSSLTTYRFFFFLPLSYAHFTLRRTLAPPPMDLPRGPHRHITTRSHHNHNHPSASFGAGREDCWAEAATETLIQAWGDRYLKLNRGNLRQKDWKEVADAVNSHPNSVQKTDVQCKNRIDTLKKKYKLEKTKPPPSKWPFYHRLDSLIGTNATVNKKTTTVTFTLKSSKPKNPNPIIYSGESKSRESSFYDDKDNNNQAAVRVEAVELSDGAASRELARAILKFGEIYERVENLKQQQIMELERERMEFTKDLEFQKMNMIVDAQLEIEKSKRQKYKLARSISGKKL